MTSLKRSRSRNRTATGRPAFAPRRQRVVEPVEEQRPVGQAGQRVVQGLLGQRPLGPGPLDDPPELDPAGHERFHELLVGLRRLQGEELEDRRHLRPDEDGDTDAVHPRRGGLGGISYPAEAVGLGHMPQLGLLEEGPPDGPRRMAADLVEAAPQRLLEGLGLVGGHGDPLHEVEQVGLAAERLLRCLGLGDVLADPLETHPRPAGP